MIRALYRLVVADALERTRSSGFMMTLVPAACLAYTVHAGYWTMRHGSHAAEPSGAYVSTMMALLSGTILSLLGFYFVKNAIDRDRRTGVGEILAATPLPAPLYMLGKMTSNFLVLSLMVSVIVLAAVWLSGTAAFEPRPGWVQIVATFALVALPLMAFTASIAVMFEAVPILRAGFGNVVWFFLWGGILIASTTRWIDVSGMVLVQDSLFAALHEVHPEVTGDRMSLSAGPPRELTRFPWVGVAWTPALLLSRVAWVGIAVAIALGSAIPFDRFDPSRRHRAGREGSRRTPAASAEREAVSTVASRRELVARLVGPSSTSALGELSRLVVLEIRLLLVGQPGLWHIGAIALIVAQIVAPPDVVHPYLLTFALIWPLLVWSRMGCRDRLLGTEDLLNAAPRPRLRQLPAAWLAGVGICVAMTLPAFVRLAAAGDPGAATALALAWLFPPSLALAAGTWSGNARTFEAVYLMLWYVGLLNQVPALDYAGLTAAAVAGGVPVAFAVASLLLLGAAAVRRGWLR